MLCVQPPPNPPTPCDQGQISFLLKRDPTMEPDPALVANADVNTDADPAALPGRDVESIALPPGTANLSSGAGYQVTCSI